MKILISLISDQQIPNICFIKEIKPDKNIFITTNKMEAKHQSDKIINTLGLSESEKIIVEPEKFDDIQEKLKNISIPDSDELIINITGGTKTMSLAAYIWGMEKKAKVYYLPINTSSFIRIPSYGSSEKIEINTALTLEEYLNAYFKEEKDREYFSFSQPFQSKEKAYEMFELFKNNKLDKNILEKIRKVRGKDFNIEENSEIKEFIKKINFSLKDDKKITKYEVEYLTGGWFEEWTYYLLKEKLNIGDKFIGLSIKRENTPSTIENEFDVMMVKDNKLYIFECKTSLAKVEGDKKKEYGIFQETLYKSASLVKDFGLSARIFLFTLDEKPKNKIEEMDKKAKFFDIKCFYRDDIVDSNKLISNIK